MKTLLLLASLILSPLGFAAADPGAARAALRAELDRPRALARPEHPLFRPATQRVKKQENAAPKDDVYIRRADTLYRAAWVDTAKGKPAASLAHLLAAATRADQVGNDALVYLIKTPDARAPLVAALQAYVSTLSSGDFRAQRMPVEKALGAVQAMEGASIPNQEWGRAFADLLRALR